MDNMATENKYIFYSSFKRLKFWDYYTLSNKSQIDSKFKLVELSEVLNQRKKNIIIDDLQTYKRCRVQIRGKGIVLRDEVLGKEIKTKKQQLCKEDDFLVAEIDAKVGGYGIVPSFLENAIVSSHYFLFEIDKSKLNPEFLSILVKCNGFSKQVKATGSTNYAAIRPYHVMEYLIPLPSIAEQNRIVEAYSTKIKLAEEQERKALAIEKSISIFIDEELGIKKSSEDVSFNLVSHIKTVNYSLLDKWGVDKQISNQVRFTKDFHIKKIKEICTVSSGGTPSRTRKDFYTGNIPWVKTTEVRNDIIQDTKEKITQEAIDNSSAKVYPKDSLIIAMYGQGATRGRTAKLGIRASTNQACAVLFNINNSIINIDYLWVYLMNEYDRLRALASGNNQPNLNAQMIKDYIVVIPPIKIQEKIKDNIERKKSKIKRLLRESQTNQEQALKEFENQIFES